MWGLHRHLPVVLAVWGPARTATCGSGSILAVSVRQVRTNLHNNGRCEATRSGECRNDQKYGT